MPDEIPAASAFQIKEVEESPTDRQERISWWRQSVVSSARVMVVGAGALGNEVVKNLALMGVGYVFLVDNDTISPSNLSRAVFYRREDLGARKVDVVARRALELAVNPAMRIQPFHGDLVHDLGLGVYRRVHLVIGCLDNVEARIEASRKALQAGIPFIDAGIRELDFRVSIFRPGVGACFECTTTREMRDASRDRYDSCTQVMRRQIASQRAPTVQVASAAAAALQCQEVIKVLHGYAADEQSWELSYHGQSQQFSHHVLPRRRGCLTCLFQRVAPEDLVVDPSLNSRIIAGDLLERAREELADEAAALEPGWDIILGGKCKICGDSVALCGARFRLFDDELQCRTCGALATQIDWETSGSLGGSDQRMARSTLQALGFAPASVVPVWSPRRERTRFYELSGDLASHGLEVV